MIKPETVDTYVRVSTGMQAEDEKSMKSQQARIEAYCTARGLVIGKKHVDAGYSAKDTKRPAYQALMKRLSSGECGGVVVFDLSRFTRKSSDLHAALSGPLAGKSFHSVTEGFDTSTISGRMLIAVLGAFAEMDREQRAERTREGFRRLKAKGRLLGAPGYGYRCEGKGIHRKKVEVPEEMKVLKSIKELRAKGYALESVADALNEIGIPAPRGGRWHGMTVQRIEART